MHLGPVLACHLHETTSLDSQDYEYHPANQDSFVNSPAVSVKVTPRGGFGEGVSVLIEGGGEL